MKKDLEKKLIDKFPTFFVDMYGDCRKTCLSHGIETNDGWCEIINKLCEDLSFLNLEEFKFTQIKQKFGTLRVYTSGGNKESSKLIDQAEKNSANICEICGSKENVKMNQNWYIETLCDKCRKNQ